MGPYVQGLSQHVVTNYQQVIQLLEAGIANRITAATHVHEASSRSHAIFTIHCTQAILQNNLPSETASKINLVDLAVRELIPVTVRTGLRKVPISTSPL